MNVALGKLAMSPRRICAVVPGSAVLMSQEAMWYIN